jgi:sulfur carrier protein ThiS adenylyltransferase
MKVNVNERTMDVDEGTTLFTLRDAVKPGADVVVYNGGPAPVDRPLHDGDAVVFICRGAMPGRDELEALMVARHSPGVHGKVKSATVGIAGLGGLGSAIAIALARIGVGRLVLADFDIVEPSNLNRQQYFVNQIGIPKTDAMKANLVQINPYVIVDTHCVTLTPANMATTFDKVDVMVEAFDRAEAKAMIMEIFSKDLPAIPLVMATGLAGYEPSNTIRTRRARDNVYLIGDGVTAAGPGMGLMAPRVGIAAHHQANAVLRLLLGEDPAA